VESLIQIETTFDKYEDAKFMADRLRDASLIACGQISEATSIYDWEGKRCESKEFVLKMKTRSELYHDCEKFILKHHPYKTPQITMTKVNSNEAYFNWVDQSTAK
jgi:periplasmic divalent cation tolerance protein